MSRWLASRGSSAAPSPSISTHDRPSELLDDDLVPEVERGGGRSRRPARGSRSTRAPAACTRHPIASSTASSSRRRPGVRPCDASTASVSLSPCPVRMQTAVSPVPGAELQRAPRSPRPTPARRRRLPRLRQSLPRTADLVLRERHDLDATGGDELGDVRRVRGLGDPDRARPGRRALGGLPDDDPHVDALPRRGPRRPRSRCRRRRTAARRRPAPHPSCSSNSKTTRLLALDPIGVERVDEHDSRAARRARGRGGAHRRSVPRSSSSRAPAATACARLAVAVAPAGVSTTAVEPRARGVGGRGGGGVAGRGADDCARARPRPRARPRRPCRDP